MKLNLTNMNYKILIKTKSIQFKQDNSMENKLIYMYSDIQINKESK